MSAELVAATRAIGELERLLVEERTAVAAYDIERVRELATRKTEQAEYTLGLLRDLRPDDTQRRVLGRSLMRLAAQARANSALLTDAIDLIGDSLGLRESTGTYDARARVRAGARALMRRDL
jgi:hypothetical protein